MKTDPAFLKEYNALRENGAGLFAFSSRGLIEVSGGEAVMFLNGLITNDVATLADGAQMTAAFPNVQGRLLAMVRVLRRGDKFLFETDEITHEKVFQNLHRFTFAGDFFAEDLSDNYKYFEIFNSDFGVPGSDIISFQSKFSHDHFVPKEMAESFATDVKNSGAIEISDELYELLRIENGVPKYGVDMDETTVVLETGLDEAVSFTKGCYIGQEIIARIHFRGHVAKKLTGLVFNSPSFEVDMAAASADGVVLNSPPFEGGVAAVSADGVVTPPIELTSLEGKSAGRITSVAFSPKLQKTIALAFVRYEFLAENTELKASDISAKVTNFPVL